MEGLELTDLERECLDRSDDLEVTRKRRRMCVVTPLLFAALLVCVSYLDGAWRTINTLLAVYIVLTALERLAYAKWVLVYKGLVGKMKERIGALEEEAASIRRSRPTN